MPEKARSAGRPGIDGALIDGPLVRYPDRAVHARRHVRRYGQGGRTHRPLLPELTADLASAERPLLARGFVSAPDGATALVPASVAHGPVAGSTGPWRRRR